MFDLFREIGQSLGNNKLRTVLTGIAVAWGIFMLIVLLGMSRGVYNAATGEFNSTMSNMVQMWGGNTTMPWRGYKEGRSIDLHNSDMAPLGMQNAGCVESVSGTIYGSTNLATSHNYVTSGYQGVFPVFLQQDRIKLEQGRFITDKDMKLRRKVIVLNKKTAQQLFPDSSKALGQIVKCKELAFTVVGIVDREWGETSYIPYTTARMLNSNSEYVGSISVELKDVETEADGEQAERDLKRTMASIHNYNPDDSGALWVWNKFTQFFKMSNGMGILNYAVWVIGLLTLLSGIIGVSNIMFVTVRERTHEIGIRRAIGAKPHNILSQIIAESIAITGLFGYIGVVMGIAATEGLKVAFAGQPMISDPTVDVLIAIEVTVVLILAGAFAGLAPAMKALKVKPVEALRTE